VLLHQAKLAGCLMQNLTHSVETQHKTHLKYIKKEFLPQRICVICKKPFTWRKKWENVWGEVKYCSDKCRMNKSMYG
jgi:hypothetical protein